MTRLTKILIGSFLGLLTRHALADACLAMAEQPMQLHCERSASDERKVTCRATYRINTSCAGKSFSNAFLDFSLADPGTGERYASAWTRPVERSYDTVTASFNVRRSPVKILARLAKNVNTRGSNGAGYVRLHVFKEASFTLGENQSKARNWPRNTGGMGSLSGKSYGLMLVDRREGNSFDAILDFKGNQAEWRYRVRNSSGRAQGRGVVTGSARAVSFDDGTGRWALEVSPDYKRLNGTYEFWQERPGKPRTRRYVVTGNILD